MVKENRKLPNFKHQTSNLKHSIMLENLFNLVKEFSGEQVINNPEIPNEKNNEVMADATHSIFTGLQNVMAGGGAQNVLSMLGGNSGNLMNNPLVQMIAGGFIKKLMGKFGLSSSSASGIASSIIPGVLNALVNRTNDPNNSSFDLNGIMNSLSGGTQSSGGFDLGSLVNRFAGGGLDTDRDGQVELSDIISKFTGGAQQQIQQQNSGGGVTGLLQQLIGGLQ
jgi:hypothetical protein